MLLRQVLALQMSALLAWSSAPARPIALGVVVEAERAHVNATPVTAGATVYDGDRYSTEPKGTVLLRAGNSMLELAEASTAHLRKAANGSEGIEAELDHGTLVFSAAPAANLEIVASGVRVRPSTDGRTVAQISLIDTKELRIYAQRGALQFSYRGERETILGGAAFRVILDPPDGSNKDQEEPVKLPRKAFLFIGVGAVAGAAIILLDHGNHGHKRMESPDRP